MQDEDLRYGPDRGQVSVLVFPAATEEVQENYRRDRLRGGDPRAQAAQGEELRSVAALRFPLRNSQHVPRGEHMIVNIIP